VYLVYVGGGINGIVGSGGRSDKTATPEIKSECGDGTLAAFHEPIGDRIVREVFQPMDGGADERSGITMKLGDERRKKSEGVVASGA
jgi:hypothetical protein